MNIDSIQNGIVLDHIKSGGAMRIYKYLDLDKMDCTVAIIKNVKSNKMGRKDIIKIDADIDINFDVLGYVDPNITVNVIRDGQRVQKLKVALPETVSGIIHCKNPRCITTVEPSAEQLFYLADREKKIYRCRYCDTERK